MKRKQFPKYWLVWFFVRYNANIRRGGDSHICLQELLHSNAKWSPWLIQLLGWPPNTWSGSYRDGIDTVVIFIVWTFLCFCMRDGVMDLQWENFRQDDYSHSQSVQKINYALGMKGWKRCRHAKITCSSKCQINMFWKVINLELYVH